MEQLRTGQFETEYDSVFGGNKSTVLVSAFFERPKCPFYRGKVHVLPAPARSAICREEFFGEPHLPSQQGIRIEDAFLRNINKEHLWLLLD